jgi:hypothetical protein
MLFLECLEDGIRQWRLGNKEEARGFFFIALLALLLLLATPYFTIESINHLFGTSIPIDFFSYCAVYWLIFLVRTTVPMGRKLQPANNQQGVWMVGQMPSTRRNNDEEE